MTPPPTPVKTEPPKKMALGAPAFCATCPALDNLGLTRNRRGATSRSKRSRRPKRTWESPQMAAMVARVSRSMTRRAAEGDVEALTALVQMREAVDAATVLSARALHDFGYTWADVGRELGVSRQAALKRFGRPDADAAEER
jgi:hypothetical protein